MIGPARSHGTCGTLAAMPASWAAGKALGGFWPRRHPETTPGVLDGLAAFLAALYVPIPRLAWGLSI